MLLRTLRTGLRARVSRSPGVTLIEIVFAIAIVLTVVLAISKLVTRGLKSSSKGAAHLTIVGSTGILLAQIEDDCRRATKIVNPPPGNPEPNIQMEIVAEDDGGALSPMSITYDMGANGLGMRRTRAPILANGTMGTMAEHDYCRGLTVAASFTHMVLPNNKVGVLVALRVSTTTSETFGIRRFVFCQNMASNTPVLGWQP